MTQIRRIRFFTAPVVQQLTPHPPETKTVTIKKDTVRKVEPTKKSKKINFFA